MLPSATTIARSDFKSKTSKDSLLPYKQMATLSQKDFLGSEMEQQLVSLLPTDLRVQVHASSTNLQQSLFQVIKEGLVHQPNEQLVACLQKLDDKVTENNELVLKNNEQGARILALLSENYKLTSENKDQLDHITELQKELASKQDEMKELQIQALDRLALLQKS
ncbi:hypothetical protein BGX34_008112, partial [Mortierella sp. NVP85]